MPLYSRDNWRLPSDVLDALDLWIAYLLPRAPVRLGELREGAQWVRMPYRRAQGQFSLFAARKLLNVNARRKGFDGVMHWALNPNWERRLYWAGIDPQTLAVIEQRRWNIAWQQLHTTFTYKEPLQMKRVYDKDYNPPLAVGYVAKRWVSIIKKKGDNNDKPALADDSEEEDPLELPTMYNRKRLGRKIIC